MEILVFCIRNGELYYNRQGTIPVTHTNFPVKYAYSKPNNYYIANILDCNNKNRSVIAEITNYNASKEDFVISANINTSFRYIKFKELDFSTIDNTIEEGSEHKRTNIFNDDSLTKRESVVTLRGTPEIYGSLGSFLNKEICLVKLNSLTIKNTLLTFDFISPNKHASAIFGNISIPEKLEVDEIREEILSLYSSDILKVEVSIHENGVWPYSPVIERVCHRLGCSFSAVKRINHKKTWIIKEPINKKIKIADLTFNDGSVSFQIWCPYSHKIITLEIANPIIKPSFDYIQKYICNLIGRQQITFTTKLEILQTENGRITDSRCIKTTSLDIDKISEESIVEIKGDYFADLIKSGNSQTDKIITTNQLENIFPGSPPLNPVDLIEIVLTRNPKANHGMQVRYLAGLHLVKLEPMRIGGNPQAYLFMIEAKNGYIFALETLHSKLATYIWFSDRAESVINAKVIEIENLMKAFEDQNRKKYKGSRPLDFKVIEHDNLNKEEGFQEWLRQLNTHIDEWRIKK